MVGLANSVTSKGNTTALHAIWHTGVAVSAYRSLFCREVGSSPIDSAVVRSVVRCSRDGRGRRLIASVRIPT